MGIWSPAFQHQFLDGNLFNFNAPPGAEPNISFEPPLVRPTPPPEDRGFPVRRGNRFTCHFEPDTFARVIGVDIKLEIVFPPASGHLHGNVVLGNETVRFLMAFSGGKAFLDFVIKDNNNIMTTTARFDPSAPLRIQTRWHTHGQAHIWVNESLQSYRPALAAGQSFPIDRIAFGHDKTSGFAPGAPAFLIRRISVKLLRDNDAARFLDGLLSIGEPAALDEACRRKLSAVDVGSARAMRGFMTQAIGKLTRAWEAPQPGGPFSAEGVAAHEAAVAAGQAFVAFLLARPGGDAALVKDRVAAFLALIQATDPAGYAQAVAGLQQLAARYDPACIAQLQPIAQQNAASLQPLADLLEGVWAKMQSPGGANG
jgi:hypothetical protein